MKRKVRLHIPKYPHGGPHEGQDQPISTGMDFDESKRTAEQADQAARDFNIRYVQSENYKKLLRKQGYSPDEIKARQDAILNLQPSLYVKEGNSMVSEGENGNAQVRYNVTDMGDWPSWQNIAAHEMGHVGVDSGRSPLKRGERRLLSNIRQNNVSSDSEHAKHDLEPQENRADLTELRQRLFETGTFDSTKEQRFTKEDLQNYKNLMKENPEDSTIWNRMFRLYEDKDIIKIMNSVASTGENNQELTQAKYGGLFQYDKGGAVHNKSPHPHPRKQVVDKYGIPIKGPLRRSAGDFTPKEEVFEWESAPKERVVKSAPSKAQKLFDEEFAVTGPGTLESLEIKAAEQTDKTIKHLEKEGVPIDENTREDLYQETLDNSIRFHENENAFGQVSKKKEQSSWDAGVERVEDIITNPFAAAKYSFVGGGLDNMPRNYNQMLDAERDASTYAFTKNDDGTISRSPEARASINPGAASFQERFGYGDKGRGSGSNPLDFVNDMANPLKWAHNLDVALSKGDYGDAAIEAAGLFPGVGAISKLKKLKLVSNSDLSRFKYDMDVMKHSLPRTKEQFKSILATNNLSDLKSELKALPVKNKIESEIKKYYKNVISPENKARAKAFDLEQGTSYTEAIEALEKRGIDPNSGKTIADRFNVRVKKNPNDGTGGFSDWTDEGFRKYLYDEKTDMGDREIVVYDDLPFWDVERVIPHELKHHYSLGQDPNFYSEVNFPPSLTTPAEISRYSPQFADELIQPAFPKKGGSEDTKYEYLSSDVEVDAFVNVNLRDELVKKGILKNHWDMLDNTKIATFLMGNPSKTSKDFIDMAGKDFVKNFNKGVYVALPAVGTAAAIAGQEEDKSPTQRPVYQKYGGTQQSVKRKVRISLPKAGYGGLFH